MRKLCISATLILILALTAHAHMTGYHLVHGVGGGATGVVAEEPSAFNFEESWNGSTEDNTWSALPSNWTDDNTTSPIEGAQDLLSPLETGAAGVLTADLPDTYSSFYVVAKFVPFCFSAGQMVGIRLKDSSDNAVCSLRLVLNTDPGVYRLRGYHSGDASYCQDTTFAATLTGIIYTKLEYVAGTGENGTVTVYAVEDAEYASNGWTNAETCTVATTTDTADVGKIELFKEAISSGFQVDEIIGNETDTVDY